MLISLACAAIVSAQPAVVKTSCVPCHNAKVKRAGLDLSTREGLLKGSEHGAVVAPGDPLNSQIYKLTARIAEPAMPYQAKKLNDDQIAAMAEWIKAGAPYGERDVDPEAPDPAEVARHWAFRKVERPSVPKGARHPVDAFVNAELTRRNLKPLASADRRTLIRRVTIDLTGLPPSPEDIAAFVNDKDPRAYDKLVDRLLASPRYGERWARHWLDVWRYSDWYGYRASNQVRYSQRHIWRWRDWTVDSLNANKPYSRMIQEMLAGDELAPSDPDTARATGYLARSWYMFNRNVWMQDTVDYTAMSFLGLTLKCARCHTHKYDPIPHSDYYRFRAFFEPENVRTDRIAGQPDTQKNGVVRVYDAEADKPTYRFIRGNEASPDQSLVLQPGVPRLFGKVDLRIQPVTLPVESYFPDGRAFVPGDLLAQAKAEIEKAEAALKKAREKPEAAPMIAAAEKRVEAAKAAVPALEARIAADLAAMATPVPGNAEQLAISAREAELQANKIRAEADMIAGQYEFQQKRTAKATQLLEAAVKALKEPTEGYTPIGPKYPTTSTGRRTALANWIASQDNPLTARVAVNHIWMRHFGAPLVSTVFNFGRSGKPPSHPALLDWLASEFMATGWDMKKLHRLLVTSDAYQRISYGTAESDPENVYLWRQNPRRMEAEVVRDSLLSLAGKLDTKMGGEEIDETKGHEIYRRSLYFRHTPDLQMDMLKAFDVASPIECFQRPISIVPQQALALVNSKLSQTMAREIAAQLPRDDTFFTAAFERILNRPPSAAELQTLRAYTGSRESVVHVLLNHNDFVTVR